MRESRVSRCHDGKAPVSARPVLIARTFMRRPIHLVACLLALASASAFSAAARAEDSPSFTSVPELVNGFHELYAQNFSEARTIFTTWESAHPDQPFGQVAVAASFLFEEMYRQGVLSSDFFLNEKRFLHGIDGKPDAERMKDFRDALKFLR